MLNLSINYYHYHYYYYYYYYHYHLLLIYGRPLDYNSRSEMREMDAFKQDISHRSSSFFLNLISLWPNFFFQ